MKLKYSPYSVFKRSTTPYGLYARTRWMGETSGELNRRIERLLELLSKRQSDTGSWNDSVVDTVENLYALSLLSPRRSTAAVNAVDWLLEKEHPSTVHISGDGSPYSGLFFRVKRGDTAGIYNRRDLPFNRGCSGFFKSGAALYFSGIFGKQNDPRAEAAFRSLDRVLDTRGGVWCSLPCSNNILRAYVSHPAKRDSRGTRKALKYLEHVQTETGGWKGTPFFYQTFNTVAQSGLPSARRQIERAMNRVSRSQNRDGTWGKTNKEFNTFLVLDGLHRRGIRPG